MPDALTMSARSIRLSARHLDALITSLALPVMLMLMFVELFGGAIETGATKYVTYVVPGVVLLCAGFGSATTAVAVSQDMTGGIVDRLRAMDVGGAAVMAGHVAASIVRNAASGVLVVAMALLLGFGPSAGVLAWLAVIGLLLLFVVAISWMAAAIGLVASSPEAANGFTFVVMFLPYASSAFVPVDTMPGWLHGFAPHQPVTPIVETLRGLLLGTPVGGEAWTALAWCAGILAVSVVASAGVFPGRTAWVAPRPLEAPAHDRARPRRDVAVVARSQVAGHVPAVEAEGADAAGARRQAQRLAVRAARHEPSGDAADVLRRDVRDALAREPRVRVRVVDRGAPVRRGGRGDGGQHRGERGCRGGEEGEAVAHGGIDTPRPLDRHRGGRRRAITARRPRARARPPRRQASLATPAARGAPTTTAPPRTPLPRAGPPRARGAPAPRRTARCRRTQSRRPPPSARRTERPRLRV